MDIKKHIEEQLHRPMDRRQFLFRTGGVVASLIGVTAMVKSLVRTKAPGRRAGYGSSAYGGGKRSS